MLHQYANLPSRKNWLVTSGGFAFYTSLRNVTTMATKHAENYVQAKVNVCTLYPGRPHSLSGTILHALTHGETAEPLNFDPKKRNPL